MPTTPAISPKVTARRVGVRTFSATSGPLLFGSSEDAARPEDQHEHQDAERHQGLKLVRRVDACTGEEQDGTHRLEDPEEETSHRGAGDAPDPTEHRCGERLDPREESHREDDLVEQEYIEDPSSSGQDTADGERSHDGPIDVDAHQAGDLLVLTHSPHGSPRPGTGDEQIEPDHEGERSEDHHHLSPGDVGPEDCPTP